MSERMNAAAFRAAMVAAYEEKSGFAPADASDLGLRLSVLAAQLESLDSALAVAEDGAFPQTASGKSLDLLAQGRGLERRAALPAGGHLRFARTTPATEDIPVPAGTLCAGAGALRFKTTQDATLEQGETEVLVPAVALQAGPEGNVPAGAVRVLLSSLPGVVSVGNPAPFAGGAQQECDERLRERLLTFMADPPGSFNAAFYRETALWFEGVASVQVLPMHRGTGTVDVIISALPGFDAGVLAEQLQAKLSQSREIGTDVLVEAADIQPVELACIVRVARGHDAVQVLAACERALGGVMATLQVGQGLPVAKLGAALISLHGVENARLIAPGADVPALPGRLLVAGGIQAVAGTQGMAEVSAQ